MLTMSAFLSPVEPAGQDISLASHVPLPWQCGEPRADTEAKVSHVAAEATRKNPLSKHAAPRLSGLPCVEDTLIHMIPAPHLRLSWVEGHTRSHETSPTSAAAVGRGTLSFT